MSLRRAASNLHKESYLPDHFHLPALSAQQTPPHPFKRRVIARGGQQRGDGARVTPLVSFACVKISSFPKEGTGGQPPALLKILSFPN